MHAPYCELEPLLAHVNDGWVPGCEIQIERETLAYHDIVRLPFVYEQYSNTGNTTLEIMRFASSDPLVTHVLKVLK